MIGVRVSGEVAVDFLGYNSRVSKEGRTEHLEPEATHQPNVAPAAGVADSGGVTLLGQDLVNDLAQGI